MEEDIEELLKRKDDYDFAYGTKIHRPYVMSEKDWELIENLLTKYKEMEEENKKLKKVKSDELIINNPWLFEYLNELYIFKGRVKEKIEELEGELTNEITRNDGFSEYREYAIDVLQELLE